MALPELAPPDVQVIQEFQTVSPSIITPTLMPCIIGPCHQYVQALNSSGSVNSDAIITLPAFAVSTNTSFTGLGGKKIKVQYKTYTAEEMTFAATPANPTAAQVVEQINNEELKGLSAQLVPDGSNNHVMIYTTASGDGEEFKFLAPSADSGMTILGYTQDLTYFGHSRYPNVDNRLFDIMLPDPNSNLDELSVDRTSIRVFLNTSGSRLVEAKRTETIIKPYNTAEITGTVDLSALNYPDDLIDKIFEMALETESEKALTLFADFRALVIAGYNNLATHYEAHRAKNGATIHTGAGGADTNNTLATTTLTSTATLTGITTAFNDMKAQYNGHDANTGGVYHVAGSGSYQISAGDASTWSDVITLYNELVADFNLHIEDLTEHGAADSTEAALIQLIRLYNELAADYTYHIANSAAGSYNLLFHSAADTTNVLATASLADSASLATVMAAYNDFKDQLTAHDANSTPHKVGAGTYAVTESDATKYSELLTLASDGADSCRTEYEAHRAATAEHYLGGDTYNTITLTKSLANVDENTVVSEVNTTWANATASLSSNKLDIQTTLGGITIGDGTANSVMGFTDDDYQYIFEAVDDGDADTQTPYMRVQNADFTAAAAAATHTGSITLDATNFPASLDGLTLILGDDGQAPQTITLSTSETDITTLITAINAVMGAGYASSATNKLKFTSGTTGHESKIWFGAGTAHRSLGLPVSTAYYGTAFPPIPGDEVWQNDAKLGEIVQVAPGSNVDRLKLDVEISNTYKKGHGWVQAKEISGSGRPTPDLNSNGYYLDLKHDVVRDYRGQPASGSSAYVISYNALRLDVSPAADDPELLVFETLSDVESTIPPVDATNPLALAASLALTNAPSVSISALGVGEVSTDKPDGTLNAYTSCLEFLEAYEVYALAPLTQDLDVHSIFGTHVTSLSQPARKRERIAIVNPALPTKKLDTVVASGTDGESTATLNQFDTKLADLVTLIAAQGLNPAALSADDGVYLDVERDSLRYNLSSVVGTIATVRVSFSATENTDNYFTTSNLPTDLLQETFSVSVKGESISTKSEQVEVYYNLGTSYANRRLVNLVPGTVSASVSGVATSLEGYYLGAAIAGMIGELHPAQGHSNYPISGFTGVSYSWPYFSDIQLNQIAAGGNFIVYQRTSGGPLVCRHQLTTDVSTINTRELSVGKALDFSSKFYRLSVQSFVGVYNISSDTWDLVALTLQSASETLKEDKVIMGADVGKPTQSKSQADKTEVSITVEVFVPQNYISITLVV